MASLDLDVLDVVIPLFSEGLDVRIPFEPLEGEVLPELPRGTREVVLMGGGYSPGDLLALTDGKSYRLGCNSWEN